MLEPSQYQLRWGFEFVNGTRKVGMWNHPGPKDDLHTKAWANNKNLKYAFIERKHQGVTKEIARAGHDVYMNFQWLAKSWVNPVAIRKAHTPVTRLVGLTMLTTDGVVEAYTDGRVVQGPPRHTTMNFATYGK